MEIDFCVVLCYAHNANERFTIVIQAMDEYDAQIKAKRAFGDCRVIDVYEYY